MKPEQSTSDSCRDLGTIKKITVLGQGVMGPDIALSMALAGFHVTGVDSLEQALDNAAVKTELNCRQMVDGGLLTEDATREAQERITRTLDWDGSVAAADFIMEVGPEIMEIKQEIFAKCDHLCAPDVIIASNTSVMSITRIAEKMESPDRAITTHWTIPAHLSPLVEVVAGEQTSDTVKSTTFELLQAMGKHPVFCRDTPGFIHNYLQAALVKAAMELMENDVASPEDIDGIVRNGFGLRIANVGPIQFLDMVGLDTANNTSRYLFETTKRPVYKPFKAIEEKVNRGDLGVKTGKGFYEYKNAAGSNEFWDQANRGMISVLKTLGRFQIK